MSKFRSATSPVIPDGWKPKPNVTGMIISNALHAWYEDFANWKAYITEQNILIKPDEDIKRS